MLLENLGFIFCVSHLRFLSIGLASGYKRIYAEPCQADHHCFGSGAIENLAAFKGV